MADFAPPSDVPDPAAAPPTTNGPVPAPGPRRIRSLPDRPVRQRPAGGIRSVPEPTRGSTRLAGTEAAIFGGDMSWRRGIGVLWTLFVLIAIGEVCSLGLSLLIGYEGSILANGLRLTVLCAGFLALWFGWGWTRWVLAVVAALAGARTLMLLVIANDALARFGVKLGQGSNVALFSVFLAVALGTLYLILAAYLIFSADVLAFVRHRREAGRRWVALPVAVLLACYWAAMLAGPFVYRHWLEGMR